MTKTKKMVSAASLALTLSI